MADKNIEQNLSESKVRIITHSNIRYEGTLYQINQKEKSIALKNVISFGTEDRVQDKVIPSSDFVYEFIVFKSVDIQNLEVLKKGTPSEPQNQPQQDHHQHRQKHIKQEKEEVQNRYDDYEENNGNIKNYQPQQEELEVQEEEKEQQEEERKQKDANYKQDDFFDTLSSSIDTKNHKNVYLDRKLAKETFGHVPYMTGRYQGRNYGRKNYRNNRGGYYNNRGSRNYRNFYKRREEEEYTYVRKQN